MRDQRQQSGFTLVEMSIVLVVVGLIVGGVVAGQSLIRIAGIKGLMTDLSDYASAVGKFRTEFRNLPGDLSNATSYWGTAAGTGSDSTCYAADESGGKATCNGDGDGTIDYYNPATAVADNTEVFLAWKHMINAGVISGPTLTGHTSNAGGLGIMAGINTPQGKIDGSAYMIHTFVGCRSSDPTLYDGCYPLLLAFGKGLGTASWMPSALITPEEMYGMDQKMDDGLPGYGQLRVLKNATTCASTANAYVLTSTNTTCAGLFGIEPIIANQ